MASESAALRALSLANLELGTELLEALHRCRYCEPDTMCGRCALTYRRLRQLNENVGAAVRRSQGG